jgi:transposase-like protein
MKAQTYVSVKDRKEIAADLKKIYTDPDEKSAAKIRDSIEEKWAKKYPHAMKSWRTNWDAIFPNDSALLKALFLATDLAPKNGRAVTFLIFTEGLFTEIFLGAVE